MTQTTATRHVVILGGGGFLGRKLAARIARSPSLCGGRVTRLTLFDIAAPPVPADCAIPVQTVAGDVAALPEQLLTGPEQGVTVFHLAAVVSAAAEADYALGRRVNIGGVDALIDAAMATGRVPRVVFTSSVASFSGGQSAVLGDDARQVPANSYGTQKAIGELLLADASRRGILQAVSLRLPTIAIRPGRPNAAASSFVSAIVREPLLGLPAQLPVGEDFAIWIASPRRAVDWLLHAAALDMDALGMDRGLNLPGLSVRVRDLLAALDSVRPGASALIERIDDVAIARIVDGWPAAFDARRALALGFAPHEPATEIVSAFLADDLGQTRAERGISAN